MCSEHCAVQSEGCLAICMWENKSRVTRRSQGIVQIFFTVLQYLMWDCTEHCSNKCIMWYHTGSQNTRVLIEYNVDKRTLLTCINQNGYKVQWVHSIYNYCTSVFVLSNVQWNRKDIMNPDRVVWQQLGSRTPYCPLSDCRISLLSLVGGEHWGSRGPVCS